MEGTMLWFNEEKGYGFIRTEDGERIYVDRSGFVSGETAPLGRCAGLPVRLTPTGEDGSRIATEVTVLVEEQRGRARRRSHGRASRS